MSTLYKSAYKWDEYLPFGKRQFVRRKEVIYSQGTIGDGFFYLHKGLVKITTSTANGNERLLNIVVPGQIMGIQAMDQEPHFTTATSVNDSVIYHFPCDKFKALMLTRPELLNVFSLTVIHKMRILLDGINRNSFSAEQQLALLLLNICDEFKNYEIPILQQDLASSAGLTRITVYKILKQWKEEALIEIENRQFYIKKPEVLRNLL